MMWLLISGAWAGGSTAWGTPYIAAQGLKDTYALKELDAIAISAGHHHTCALVGDGSAWCWGDDSVGQVSGTPWGIYEQISAGADHTCAVDDNRKISCWGDNSSGQLDVPPGTYRRVAAGSDFTCAVAWDRSVVCWGAVPANVPSGTGFSRIGAGAEHACVYSNQSRSLTCFGDNAFRQAQPPAQPSDLGLLGSLVQGGERHTCAIASGFLGCFGDDSAGQVSGVGGNPSFPSAPWALESPDYRGLWLYPGDQWRDVDGADHHTCGINTDNSSSLTLYCWGDSPNGEAEPPSGSFLAVTTGWSHSCAIDSAHKVRCWGDNALGQTDVPRFTAVRVVRRWDTLWNFLVLDE